MKIALIAGETSGDQLGGWLMAALKRQSKTPLTFVGLGGARMQEQGLTSIFPMADISLIGITEVLPHALNIKRRIRQTVEFIEREQPDVLVTIDVPGFVLRVLKQLHKRGKARPRLVHYVAPTVWAYNEWRAEELARLVDKLLTLFPFEPGYFTKHGLDTEFVGHEIAWWWKERGDGASFRARHGIPAEAPLLALFPGSRHGELNRMLPTLGKTVERLAAKIPGLQVVVQVPEPLKARLAVETSGWKAPTLVLDNREEKRDLFAAAIAALAKSGTVALECALAGLPLVVTYKANPLSVWMVRRIIKIDYVHIANLMAKQELIPELIQEKCNPDALAEAVLPLLTDESARAAQRANLTDFAGKLGAQEAESPSDKAARAILALA